MKVVGREDVQRLMEQGAQVVETLEKRQYDLAHLPGALHLPPWKLTAERAAGVLDRDRPVVAYCFDSL